MAGEKILVLDDVEIVCDAFKEELEQEGYKVDSALTAKIAFQKTESAKYQLIFVDMFLPDTDGVEACKRLKKISPGSILVFMTGRLDSDPIQKEVAFIEAGGRSYFLYKPFVEGEILQVTKKALSEKDTK